MPSSRIAEPETMDEHKISRFTQTVGKVPKVYLTQAWKFTKTQSLDSTQRTDFR